VRSATDDEEDSAVPTLTALGTVALIAGVAAIAAVSESVSLAIETSNFPPSSVAATQPCRACGVVESVTLVQPRAAKHDVSTVTGGGPEGVAVLLGALGGTLRVAAVPVHEVMVKMDDGSVRAVHERGLPAWKQGDRVRMFKGELLAVPAAEMRGELRRVGCNAEANERVLVAWKDGRHYCIRYDRASGAPRGVEPAVFALQAAAEVN
jgi:hypothetical protein